MVEALAPVCTSTSITHQQGTSAAANSAATMSLVAALKISGWSAQPICEECGSRISADLPPCRRGRTGMRM